LKNIRNIAVFTDNKRKKITFIDKILSFMSYEEYDTPDNDSMDWMTCERDIDTIIFTPVISESWLGREVNMINFSSILELNTMRVIDGGITLLSAISDIQPLMIELRKVQIKYNIPSVIFVGQIEKKGANFFALVQQIKGRLTTVPLVTQLPIYQEDKFIGLIDLIDMKELIWEKVTDDEYYLPYYRDRFIEHEIREELISQAIEYHNKIIEQIVEVDGNENLMEKFLEDREITQEEMVKGIRIATVAMAVTPIFIVKGLY